VSERGAAPEAAAALSGGGGGVLPGGRGWRLAVDTGGTFTDCLAVDPAGRLRRAKVLSSAALRTRVAERLGEDRLRLVPLGLPAGFFAGCVLRRLAAGGSAAGVDERAGVELRVIESGAEPAAGGAGAGAEPAAIGAELVVNRPLPPGEWAGAAVELLLAAEEAPLLAARLLTGTPPGQPLPPLTMRLATTRGTNALLERKGAPVALFITRGFGDLLRIGTQQRPDLFALNIERPAPLYREVIEVPERLAADGTPLVPLDLDAVRRPAAALLAAGVRCAAVALLHSYRNPEHERRLGDLLRGLGFEHVALSAELAPLIKLLPRAETAVVDAYLAPVLAGYLDAVAAALPRGALHVMTSAGGLVRAGSFRAKDSLLSGPAGGVVGAARCGRRSGYERVIAFDMGGTSTDVARYDGDFEYLFEHRVGDAHLVAPALAIESVAAGGGSLCAYAGGRLQVGPQSAGAHPGPACYGAGGPLTLTDVNLLLGRLSPGRFEIPLAPGAAERAADALLAQLEAAGELGPVPDPAADPTGAAGRARTEVLEGLLAIANERMAEAIRGISLRRGYDPAEYALVAFGGAGAQHACAVAELLGMETVLVPADAGLLSALGLAVAVIERFAQRQVLAPLGDVAPRLDAWCDELGREAAAAVAAEGVPPDQVAVRRRIVALRFAGQESTLPVDYAGGGSLAADFAAAYRAVYGYEPEGRPIEVESLRVVASSAGGETLPLPGEDVSSAARTGAARTGAARTFAQDSVRQHSAAGPPGRQRACFAGSWQEVPAHEREALVPGDAFPGPALVLEAHTATVVEPGWDCRLDGAGALVLRRLRRFQRGAVESAGGGGDAADGEDGGGRGRSYDE
jgi:5-oxoprolinase (ATP-hydrolysing)